MYTYRFIYDTSTNFEFQNCYNLQNKIINIKCRVIQTNHFIIIIMKLISL